MERISIWNSSLGAAPLPALPARQTPPSPAASHSTQAAQGQRLQDSDTEVCSHWEPLQDSAGVKEKVWTRRGTVKRN